MELTSVIAGAIGGAVAGIGVVAVLTAPFRSEVEGRLRRLERRKPADRIHDIYIVTQREDGSRHSEQFSVPEEHQGKIKGCYVGGDGKTVYFSDLIKGCRKEAR